MSDKPKNWSYLYPKRYTETLFLLKIDFTIKASYKTDIFSDTVYLAEAEYDQPVSQKTIFSGPNSMINLQFLDSISSVLSLFFILSYFDSIQFYGSGFPSLRMFVKHTRFEFNMVILPILTISKYIQIRILNTPLNTPLQFIKVMLDVKVVFP